MPKANPKDQKITISHLAKHYSDEGVAYEFMEKLRWPNGPVCPRCGHERAYFLKPHADRYTRTGHASQRRLWKCARCRNQFSVLIGTVFEDSRIPLSKWLLGMHMMCSNKNGVAARELARTLEITVKSAWFMAHRLRYALEHPSVMGKMTDKLDGIVEADETYVGGKLKGHGKGFHVENKTPVLTLVERGGEARSRVLDRVTGENIRQALAEEVDASARLMTDENNLYIVPGRTFASHETVEHRAREYARPSRVHAAAVHCNTAEGYFSQLKRSIDGTHHQVSREHLHRYVAEFDFRYNTRRLEDGERTVRAIRQAEGKRLRYRSLDAES